MPQCIVDLSPSANKIVEKYQLDFSRENGGAVITKANAISLIIKEYRKGGKCR